MVSESAIDALLCGKGLFMRREICQTAAEQEFDLEYHHLHGLEYTMEENPHGSSFTPQKMYNMRDVARTAIQVNGPSGENIVIRAARAQAVAKRIATKEEIEKKRTEQVAKFEAVSPIDKECKDRGLTPWSKLSKKDVERKFNINWRDLNDMNIPFEEKTNPINPRFAKMRLYKAKDVAAVIVRQREGSSQQQAVARARGLAVTGTTKRRMSTQGHR